MPRLPLRRLTLALLLLGLGLLGVTGCTTAKAIVPVHGQRIVFLGDSITDRGTYLLLVQRALQEAEVDDVTCINAGVTGDTAAQMLARLDRDVLVHHPDMVALHVGTNDVNRHVPLADFERDVVALADRLDEADLGVLIMTSTILGEQTGDADLRIRDYNAVLRALARRRGYRLADVYGTMDRARYRGAILLEADDLYVNPAGHRLIARAVLDALGHPYVDVPENCCHEVLPGLVSPWHFIAVLDGKTPPLTPAGAADLVVSESWIRVALPQALVGDHWWRDQERFRGIYLGLDQRLGKAARYLGVADYYAPRPGLGYINTGGLIETVWCNGGRVHRQQGWTGYHPGKERIAVPLRQGLNRIVIETGPDFFLSITETNTW